MEKKATTQLKKHNISLLTAFMIIFCMVCAGGYGIEDMIPSSGPGLTLLLLIILPFFWSIPQGLIAAELGSAIPEEGGFYIWVRRTLGEFWGFVAGWCHTLSVYVDCTLYVVLSADYINKYIDLNDWQSFLFKAFFIMAFAYINIRGLSDVGRVASYLSVIVIAAFVVLIYLGFSNWQYNPFSPIIPPGQTLAQSIGLGIAICMWTYSGYECLSPMAGEMKNPQIIPKAILISMPIIMLFFILPTMAGLAGVGHWQMWATEGANSISFANIVTFLGYPGFSILFIVAFFVSNMCLYNAFLASGSRGFFIMADDGLAPPFFKKLHPKYKTPYVAIITMAAVNLFLCQYGFKVLVVIDVFLIMFSCILVYIAVIVLRLKEPHRQYAFKIPVGIKGLIALAIPPTLISIIAFFTNGIDYYIGGALGILSAPLAFLLFKRLYGGEDGKPMPKGKDKKSLIALTAITSLFLVGGVIYYCFWM